MYPSPLHREMETSGFGIPIHQLARTYDELTVLYVKKRLKWKNLLELDEPIFRDIRHLA